MPPKLQIYDGGLIKAARVPIDGEWYIGSIEFPMDQILVDVDYIAQPHRGILDRQSDRRLVDNIRHSSYGPREQKSRYSKEYRWLGERLFSHVDFRRDWKKEVKLAFLARCAAEESLYLESVGKAEDDAILAHLNERHEHRGRHADTGTLVLSKMLLRYAHLPYHRHHGLVQWVSHEYLLAPDKEARQ